MKGFYFKFVLTNKMHLAKKKKLQLNTYQYSSMATFLPFMPIQ